MDDLYQRLQSIKKERDEVTAKMSPLNEQMRELNMAERELDALRASVNVGRCFIADSFSNPKKFGFVKILDVPRPAQGVSGVNYNPYQYPVLYIPPLINGDEISSKLYSQSDDLIPFQEDTLYSHSVRAEDPYETLSKEYQEISEEAFEARFNQVVADMRRRMGFKDTGNVIHGQWLYVDGLKDAFDCSICGAMVKKKHDFCPKCGAMMDLVAVCLGGDGRG